LDQSTGSARKRDGDRNLHHVKIKGVRRILVGCKCGLCVVHCEGAGGRVGEKESDIGDKRKRKDELEERVCERERRSVVELVDGSREKEKKRTRTKTKKERSAVYFYR
jgi:hypothetical protein